MPDNSEQLKKALRTSSLNVREQEALRRQIAVLDPEIQKGIRELFVENPGLITYLYINFVVKRYAIASGDQNLLNTILQQERQLLRTLV